MKLPQIVTSLLDTDLYKFNMNQVIFHKHTDLNGEYYFKCRNENVVFTPEMLEEINSQIDCLCALRFRKDELDYLRSIRFIKKRLRGVPPAVAPHPGICGNRADAGGPAGDCRQGPAVLCHAV